MARYCEMAAGMVKARPRNWQRQVHIDCHIRVTLLGLRVSTI